MEQYEGLDEMTGGKFRSWFKRDYEFTRKVALQVKKILGKGYAVYIWQAPTGNHQLVVESGTSKVFIIPTDPVTVAAMARGYFEVLEVDRLLAQNNFLIQRIDSLVSECNDLDRLKAKNLDLKRKLRDARSEVTRYQREYIDLLERRGQ